MRRPRPLARKGGPRQPSQPASPKPMALILPLSCLVVAAAGFGAAALAPVPPTTARGSLRPRRRPFVDRATTGALGERRPEDIDDGGGGGGASGGETWAKMLRRRRRRSGPAEIYAGGYRRRRSGGERAPAGGGSGSGGGDGREEAAAEGAGGGAPVLATTAEAAAPPPPPLASESEGRSAARTERSPPRGGPASSSLPPWLARHGSPSFSEPRPPGRALPPAAAAAAASASSSSSSSSSFVTRNGEDAVAVARLNLDILRGALAQHASYVRRGSGGRGGRGGGRGGGGGGGGGGLTPAEIDDVVEAVRVAAEGDWKKVAGAAEFLCLLLSVEEDQFGVLPEDDGDDLARRARGGGGAFSIMNRDTLIASAFHYCDCVTAHKMGVYDMVSEAVRRTRPDRSFADAWNRQLMPAGYAGPSLDGSAAVRDDETRSGDDAPSGAAAPPPPPRTTSPGREEEGRGPPRSRLAVARRRASRRGGGGGGGGDIERFGEGAARIARGAARIKRAEVLADAVSFGDVGRADGTPAVAPSRDEASTLRGLLLSVSDDWRSLAIRSVACLYRLRGILRFGDVDGDGLILEATRTPEMIRTAREALRVYAPLAERLGMHRLKADLEGLSFRVLFRRQDRAARALYSAGGDAMREVEEYLSKRVEEVLGEDDTLCEQLEGVRVMSRVKAPYSLWKKLLKKRAGRNRNRNEGGGGEFPSVADSADELSLLDVQDAIALRVILRARRLYPAEDDDSVRTRECLLCYYAQKLLTEVWPPTDATRVKDYIGNPKPNGYQSIHYTASVFRHGASWPFEVQIRSEEMHRIAEYGVAAHWDYKLGAAAAAAPPQVGQSQPLALMGSAEDIAKELEHVSEEPYRSEAEIDSDVHGHETDAFVLVASEEQGSYSDSDSARIASYIEALTASRESLVQEKVFVFVSPTSSALDGKILPLAQGSSVAEALSNIKEQHGVECNVAEEGAEGMFRNGQKTDLDEELANGDVLTLPISCVWE